MNRLAVLLAVVLMVGCAFAHDQTLQPPSPPPAQAYCEERFGLTVCWVPGWRLPIWDPYCDQEEVRKGNPACIPSLREV